MCNLNCCSQLFTFIGLFGLLPDYKLLGDKVGHIVGAQIFVNITCIVKLLDNFVSVDKSITTLAS